MALKNIKSNLEIPEGEPPTEFLLIKYGTNISTTQSNYSLDEQSAKEVIAVYKKRGIKLFFDYNHLSLDPKTPEDGIAAGWFDLELRDDGIWAKNIKWTPKGFEKVKTREYAYFSPALTTNKNGYVTRLVNTAIVNLPDTEGIDPIIALSEKMDSEMNVLLKSANSLLDKYKESGLSPEKNEIESLKEIVTKLTLFGETMESMENELEPELVQVIVLPDEEEKDNKSGEKMKEHLMKLDESMDYVYSMGQHLSKMMMDHSDEGMKGMYSKAHGMAMKLADMFTEKRKEIDPHGMFAPKPMNMYSEKLIKDVVDITGETEEDRQVGKLMAFKETVSRYSELVAEVEQKDSKIKELEQKIEEVKAYSEKEKIVDAAIRGAKPKLFPRQREFALSLTKAQLDSYLESAPIIALSEKIVDVAPKVGNEVELTEIDKTMIANYNLDVKKYKEEKAKKMGNSISNLLTR